jgi:hypothetical protein
MTNTEKYSSIPLFASIMGCAFAGFGGAFLLGNLGGDSKFNFPLIAAFFGIALVSANSKYIGLPKFLAIILITISSVFATVVAGFVFAYGFDLLKPFLGSNASLHAIVLAALSGMVFMLINYSPYSLLIRKFSRPGFFVALFAGMIGGAMAMLFIIAEMLSPILPSIVAMAIFGAGLAQLHFYADPPDMKVERLSRMK